ncbi:hypothetical protein AYO41_01975 [Verrucomicrobia bacterium SCGC AG-212-E04]|nr:hypothetical protein AYO41_01975 [Verrucomicrobia bacterium SCGC AG-212-E04]
MIRAALFDIGNVILPFDFAPALARLRARSRLCEPAAWQEIDALKLAYEGGRIVRADFIAGVRHHVGFDGSDDEFVKIWTDIFAPNPRMDALIDRLHGGGLPLYLLSNTSDIHVEAFQTRYPIFGRFSGAVYSHEERLLKPDAEIFRRAIDRFSLSPAETIYIDDLAPNVEAAAALGFIALQYDFGRHDVFERQLIARLG